MLIYCSLVYIVSKEVKVYDLNKLDNLLWIYVIIFVNIIVIIMVFMVWFCD